MKPFSRMAAVALFLVQTSPLLALEGDLRMTAKGAKQGVITENGPQAGQWIPVLEVQHGMALVRDASGAPGKSIMKSMVVTVPMGASFPALYDAAANGEFLTEVTISALGADGGPVWILSLKDALIVEAALDARTGKEPDKKSLRLTLTSKDVSWGH